MKKITLVLCSLFCFYTINHCMENDEIKVQCNVTFKDGSTKQTHHSFSAIPYNEHYVKKIFKQDYDNCSSNPLYFAYENLRQMQEIKIKTTPNKKLLALLDEQTKQID